MLEASQVPEQQTLASFIHKGVTGLGVESIEKLRVYGRRTGDEVPTWSQEFELREKATSSSSPTALPKQATSPTEKIVQKNALEIKNAVLVECKGESGVLVLTDTEIIIKRKGGFMSPFKKGEKYIPYEDILNFQFRGANVFSLGYIYFQLSGLAKEISFLEVNKNENAVIFQNYQVKAFDNAKDILIQKVNPKKYDNVFEGLEGSLILTETGVIIKRAGGLFSSHPVGEKNIPYKSITAVQFKRSGVTVGFIQFTLKGGIEAKGGAFQAVTDENSVIFSTEEKTQEFEKAKNIIEQKIVAVNSISPISNNNDLNQLEKLASLKDKGIITEEEFQAKKKQILGL